MTIAYKASCSKALRVALHAHEGQTDKGGRAYICHPIAVAGIASDYFGADDELTQVCMLHDVIEDTAITAEDLVSEGFSDKVIDAVLAMTKMNGQSYEDYIDGVLANELASKAKLSDLTHNMDPRRMIGTTQKDLDRMCKYMKSYEKIRDRLHMQ